MKQKSQVNLLLCILVTLALALVIGGKILRASSPAQDDLDAVWRRVQQAGAYHFGVDMTQTETPQATVFNAGRQSKSNTYYMQGETDLAAEALHLTIWSQGGSALLPASGMEMTVNGDTARARRGQGPWQEVENFTGLFAPGGDFLTFARTAKHVVRHDPELRNTVAGAIEVTRFTFDIDGRAYALQMLEQMRAQATREGLPANMHFDLPKVYAEMTGTGELWVGADGLPLRQTFALQFPETEDNYVSSSAVTVDFSDFAPLPPPGWSNRAARLLSTGLDVVATPGNGVILLLVTLTLVAAAIVIVQRRARPVYMVVVIAVITSMVAAPLMNTQQVYAYSSRQEAKQQAQDAARDKQTLAATARAALKTTDFAPHQDPLATAQEAAAAQQVVGADDTTDRYLDASCETDPNGDLDGDTLTNLEECLLGTLPTDVDSDNDGVDDNVEVAGFSYNGQIWYTNPLDADSNKDGLGDGQEWLADANSDQLPDDTDGDGVPDVWDEDNDGDTVPDDLDMSIYVQTGSQRAAGVGETKLFDEAQPLQLTFGDLKAGELVNVEFQLKPTNPDHLWYTRNVLDWPRNDRQGQIQDVDGVTFYDLDNSLDPSPNANGDMRMAPMLEIEMSSASANLPPSAPCTSSEGVTKTCYPLLQQFGISVQQTSENTLAAYIPLQLVSDGNGETNVAFYGKMIYQASGLWKSAHKVRMVWAIEALNDICEEYADNVCTSYSAYNVPQIVQTYYDDWHLTGLTLTEERGNDTALIYEDPTQVASPDSYGAPLYLDALYGLFYGLDSSFLAGRDCDSVDANGDCVGNGTRDITVPEINRRFDHATNASVSAEERWGAPNVFSVVAHHYESQDLAALDTAVTQTVQILDNVFTSQWATNNPITPTILLASEQHHRAFNFDQIISDGSNLSWNGNGLTINLPQSGDHAVEVQTLASLKWTPYAYDPIDGWQAADITAYWDVLTAQLGDRFDGLPDDEAETYHTMAQMVYLAVQQGLSYGVQLGDQIYAQAYQTSDVEIENSIAVAASKLIQVTLKVYFAYTEGLQKSAEVIRLLTQRANPDFNYIWRFEGPSVSRFLRAKISQISTTKLVTAAIVGGLIVGLLLTSLIAKYIVGDTWAGWDTIGQASILALSLIFTLIVPIVQVLEQAKALVAIGQAATLGRAIWDTISTVHKLFTIQTLLNVVALVLAIGVAFAVFAWAVASGKVSKGEIAYNQLLAQTIASAIIAVLIFVLALNIAGSLLFALISIVDLILELAGLDFTLMGGLADALAGIIYRFKIHDKYDIDAGTIRTHLADPELGFVAGNMLAASLPITTTLSRNFISDGLTDHSFRYELNNVQQTVKTKLGDRANDYTLLVEPIEPSRIYNAYKAQVVDTPTYTQTLQAGVNQTINVHLNSGYALRGTECWFIFCSSRTVDGSTSEFLGKIMVMDVLPATLDDFVKVNQWGYRWNGSVSFLDADGDGLLPASAGGLDRDDTKWDSDSDGLNDGYEVFLRSKPVSQGGILLDPTSADTDNDGVRDDVELRYGTNPAQSDTDGDGLSDAAEIPPGGGWMLPFRYDAASQTVTETRVWSDPLHADGDGDGLSDLFERTQITCPTCNPWANPDNPALFNPNVWNQSPVALYVNDDTVGGFVAPGATVVYSTTTANNLGSGQELVGDLSLAVPDGVNGGPLAAPVIINNGESASLVSNLSFANQNTASYDLTSRMDLTNFFETRWAWEGVTDSGQTALNGNVESIAVTPVSGWDAPFVVVTSERSASALTINAYMVRSDGTVVASTNLRSSAAVSGRLTGPDVVCNEQATCLVAWGEVLNLDGPYSSLWVEYVKPNLASGNIAQQALGYTLTAPNVATDGNDFMVAWGQYTGSDLKQMRYNTRTIPGSGNATGGRGFTVGTLNTAQGAIAVEWNGSTYSAIWTGDGNLHRIDVDTAGLPTAGGSVIGAGGGWPQSDGSVRAPVLSYDALSRRMMLAYRDPSGALLARILTAASSGDPFPLAQSGADGDDLIAALSADAQNSGWVIAWAAGETITYRAIAPTGSLRGAIAQAQQAALTTLALTCSRPRALVDLPFDEGANATTFADVSGNGRDAVCSDACPQSGVSGRVGNAITFNGVDQALQVEGIDLANRSFTLATWFKPVGGVAGERTIFFQGVVREREDVINVVWLTATSQDVVCYIFAGKEISYVWAERSDDLWHHWACVYDKPTQRFTLYQDGMAIRTRPVLVPFTGSSPLYIGKAVLQEYEEEISDLYLSGSLDEAVVVDRALSADEIAELAQGAAAAFALDEPQGADVFVNDIGSGLNGYCESAASCPTLGAPGAAYTAATFDGQDDHIAIGAQSSSLALANSSFTLSAWARRDQAGQGHMIMSQGQVAANQGLQFGFRPTNLFTCGFWNNDLNTPNPYTDKQWHHWVCTYDATTKVRTIYRDGAQVAQDTASANYSNSGLTYIGQRLDGNWRFKGAIDEVGVWHSALSAAEVQTLFEKVKVADESALTCQLPTASGAQLTGNQLILRQTTTLLGEINQNIERTITVDNDKPTAAIAADYFSANGNPGYVRSQGALVVAGEANDPSSYIAQVEVDAGGGWQTVAGAESWAYTWPTAGLSDGLQTLNVRATDAVGNVGATGQWTTILDNTPPNVTVQAPATPVRPTRSADGGWQVTLSGSVADPAAGSQPGSGVAAVDVLLHGLGGVSGLEWQPATVNGTGVWQVDYLLTEAENANMTALGLTGDYSITVRASDALSNTGASSGVLLTLDAAGPVITPSVALSNTQRITAAIEVNGTVADDSAVSAVEVNLTPGEQMGALDGVELQLPFDERHATAYFADQSGSNNAATCSSGQCPTVGEAGQRDRAVRFNGNGQYLTLPNILNPAATPFSAAVWFKVDALGKAQYLLQQADGDGTGRAWLALTATGEVHTFLGGSGLNSKAKIAPGAWHQAAVTYDGAMLRIYVDGILDTTSTRTVEASIGPMLIGANKTPNLFYNGLLDELVVYDRALADYEVMNLYRYGAGSWQAATLSGNSWRYTIPAGADGLEGLHQLNVRGIDALGNVTPLGGQRVWRGEIDTRPPQLIFRARTDQSGATPTTTYTCIATDFNLVEETTCLPGKTPAIPSFRAADRVLTSYAAVDPWYAETITDTARLDRLDAARTYPNEAVSGQTMTACDAYGHCSEVAESIELEAIHTLDAEVLEPTSGIVLTSTEPITVTGDLYAAAGLRALDVTVNGMSIYTQDWATNDVTSATWSFPWTPPGEGIYRFVASIDDWTGETPPTVSSQPTAPTNAPDQALTVTQEMLTEHLYLPWVAAAEAIGSAQAGGTFMYLPLVSNHRTTVTSDYAGEGTTYYVDLTPPTIDIDADALTTTHELGENVVLLTGAADDSVDLHRVDVRIDGGPWQRAGIDGRGGWQWQWWFDAPPDGQAFEVSARAADVAGHTTTVTKTVVVDLVAPDPGEVTLTYVNQAGENLPVAPGATLTDAATLAVSWAAASDASGPVYYEVGFSASSTPGADELTRYAGAGVHTMPVSPGQRWYASVRFVDNVGNAKVNTLGAIAIQFGGK